MDSKLAGIQRQFDLCRPRRNQIPEPCDKLANLDFTIQVSGAEASEMLGTGVVLLNYDSDAFGENVCGTNAVSVNPGALINATFPVY